MFPKQAASSKVFNDILSFLNDFICDNEPLSSHDYYETNVTSVRFLLWTRSNPPSLTPEVLPFGNPESVSRSTRFDARRDVAIIVHGYRDVPDTQWIRRTATELLKRGESKRTLINDHADRDKEKLKFAITCYCEFYAVFCQG